MELKKGTILVAKNYIKCYVPSFQFEVGTEFVYLFSYQGCYMVQRSHNRKLNDGDNLLPEHSGEGGCLLAVKPCDVEVTEVTAKENDNRNEQDKAIQEILDLVDTDSILNKLIECFKKKYPFFGHEVIVPNPPVTIDDTQGFHASGDCGLITKLRINPKTTRFEYWHSWWRYGWFDDDDYKTQKIEALKQVLKSKKK